MEPFANSLQHLLAELGRLDLMLQRHVTQLKAARQFIADDFRGLFVPDTLVEAILDDSTEPPVDDDLSFRIEQLRSQNRARAHGPEALLQLEAIFNLTPIESDILLIAVAPEIDSRYEVLFSYAQNDVTKKRPTVDLALKLVCASVEERLEVRACLEPDGALVRGGLIAVVADTQNRDAPLPSRYLRVDPRAAAFVLERNILDSRVEPFTRFTAPNLGWDDLLAPPDVLSRLTRSIEVDDPGAVYWFEGPAGSGKQSAAEVICGTRGLSMLSVDLRKLPSGDSPIGAWLRLEAILLDAGVYLDRCEALLEADAAARNHFGTLIRDLRISGKPLFLGSTVPWQPELNRDIQFCRVHFAPPGLETRRKLWERALHRADANGNVNAAALAGKFSFSAAQIRRTVEDAAHSAMLLHTSGEPKLTSELVHEAARAQSSHTLRRLAQKVHCVNRWPDLILPSRVLVQLHEIERSIKYREAVYSGWGFERKMSLGRGVNVLFSGPSGTGKTMAASILALELDLDLYKVDLATVVSKYIGETEKNLSEIFREAQMSNAIVFFDEADALFGKRSEVKDAHDRYANIEIAYLLQRMEEYEGVVILSTNLAKNIDEAFARRLRHTIEFPFPDIAHRERIWRGMFPPEAPIDAAVDFGFLARQFELAGGNIRNVALAAAFLAAEEQTSIRMEHLIFGTERELQKLGRLPSKADFRDYYELIRQRG